MQNMKIQIDKHHEEMVKKEEVVNSLEIFEQ